MTNCSRRRVALPALCVAFALLFSSFTFAQTASSESEQTQGVQNSEAAQNSSETASASQQGSGWERFGSGQSGTWSPQGLEQAQSQPSSLGLFVRMIFALAVVLLIAYIVIRLLKRGTKLSNSDAPFLRHVSHLALSASRSVDVVTILDHAYILGVSDNAVNLVGEITDKELVNSMNLYADKNDSTTRPRSFADVLDIFMPRGQRNQGESIYGSSAWNASEMLRRQRERLNENEGGEE